MYLNENQNRLINSKHHSFFLFSDVGMRVGSDYQANIPEFDPGRKKRRIPPLRT